MVKKLLALTCLLWAHALWATTVKLELSDTEKSRDAQGNAIDKGYVGTPITITVTVTEGDRDTGTVTIDGLDALQILGQTQSTNVQMINGAYASEKSYVYTAQANKPGTFTIGPATVTLSGGATAKSDTATLQIIEGQPQPEAAQNAQAQGDKPEVLCSVHIAEHNIVVGQPVEAFVTILARGPVREMAMRPPEFPGFTVKETNQFAQRTQRYNGKEYDVREKKFILTALEPGTKHIPAIQIDYTYAKPETRKKRRDFFFDNVFSNFFDGPQLARGAARSQPITLDVKDLPATSDQTQQADGVGQFTGFTVKLDKQKATINEPIVMTLELTGKGNFDQIPDLTINMPDFIKFYTSKVDTQEAPDLSSGKKTFEYIVQVNKPGIIEIPEQKFTYFDPTTKNYKELTTLKQIVSISPGQTATPGPNDQPVTRKQAPQETVKTQDISFIEEDARIVPYVAPGLPLWLFILLVIVPAMIFNRHTVMYAKKYIQTRWLSQHTHQKKLADSLARLETMISKNDPTKLYHFFLDFFATKFNHDLSIVSQQWIEKKLKERGWSSEKITEFIDFLNECAGVAFISRQTATPETQALLKKAQYWFLILNQ